LRSACEQGREGNKSNPRGRYLRSSAIWNFDFENNLGYIPVGLGAGKVMQIGQVAAYFFVAPQ
jgi:hypothetical protein